VRKVRISVSILEGKNETKSQRWNCEERYSSISMIKVQDDKKFLADRQAAELRFYFKNQYIFLFS